MGDTGAGAGVEPVEQGGELDKTRWSKGMYDRGFVEVLEGPQDGETLPEKARTVEGGREGTATTNGSRVRLVKCWGLGTP